MPIGDHFLQISLRDFRKRISKPLDSVGTVCVEFLPDKFDMAQNLPSAKATGSTPTVMQIPEPFLCLARKCFPERNKIQLLGGVWQFSTFEKNRAFAGEINTARRGVHAVIASALTGTSRKICSMTWSVVMPSASASKLGIRRWRMAVSEFGFVAEG